MLSNINEITKKAAEENAKKVSEEITALGDKVAEIVNAKMDELTNDVKVYLAENLNDNSILSEEAIAEIVSEMIVAKAVEFFGVDSLQKVIIGKKWEEAKNNGIPWNTFALKGITKKL